MTLGHAPDPAGACAGCRVGFNMECMSGIYHRFPGFMGDPDYWFSEPCSGKYCGNCYTHGHERCDENGIALIGSATTMIAQEWRAGEDVWKVAAKHRESVRYDSQTRALQIIGCHNEVFASFTTPPPPSSLGITAPGL